MRSYHSAERRGSLVALAALSDVSSVSGGASGRNQPCAKDDASSRACWCPSIGKSSGFCSGASVDQLRPLVLVVDDDDDFRESLGLLLDERGYDVANAGDADAAVELMHARRPNALIIDVMLPGETGLSMWRRMRPAFSDVPVVLLSASKVDADDEQGVVVMRKPFALDLLLARLPPAQKS